MSVTVTVSRGIDSSSSNASSYTLVPSRDIIFLFPVHASRKIAWNAYHRLSDSLGDRASLASDSILTTTSSAVSDVLVSKHLIPTPVPAKTLRGVSKKREHTVPSKIVGAR